jgi:signal transduction histidine kinase
LFHEGQEKETFRLAPGERFSSGETVFELHYQAPHTLTVQLMEESNQQNAEHTLKVLLRFQELFREPLSESDLLNRSVQLLRSLLPGAEVAFFVTDSGGEPRPLTPATLRPSFTLMARCREEKLPHFHIWDEEIAGAQPTRYGGERWALAAPLRVSTQELTLYAVGSATAQTPGEFQRSALSLVAQLLTQHLEGRRALVLQAKLEAQEQLVQSRQWAAAGRLAANAAHELNTPLGAIRLAA